MYEDALQQVKVMNNILKLFHYKCKEWKTFFLTYENSQSISVSFVIGGAWVILYRPAGQLHDLILMPALCGDDGQYLGVQGCT